MLDSVRHCRAIWSERTISGEGDDPIFRSMPNDLTKKKAMLRRQRLRLLDRFLDRAYHIECILRKMIVLARKYCLKAANGIFELDIAALQSSKLLGYEKRLRQKPLH